MIPLSFICALAGTGLIFYTLYLIQTKKLQDRDTKEATVLEVFGIFKMSTGSFAIGIFIIGAALLIIPLSKMIELTAGKKVTIFGELTSTVHPIEIYAVAETESIPGNGAFSIGVPVGAGKVKDYKIIYLLGSTIVYHDLIDTSSEEKGEIRLPKRINLDIVGETSPIYDNVGNPGPNSPN
jgi:hypothetical protein